MIPSSPNPVPQVDIAPFFKGSEIAEDSIEYEAIARNFPKAKRFQLVYSGKNNGWNRSQFHNECDGVNNTLVLFKTSKDFRFGGFTKIPWSSTDGWKADDQSFLFSVDTRGIRYNIEDRSKAIYHDDRWGPNFGGEDMELIDDPMNAINAGVCTVGQNRAYTNIKLDSDGKHPLTGDGKGVNGNNQRFTCAALEVYHVQF